MSNYTETLRSSFPEMQRLEEPIEGATPVYVTFIGYTDEKFEDAVEALKQKVTFEECYTLEVFTQGHAVCLVASQDVVETPFV